ncbi:hypothetical protein GCM10029992_21110 [Glycomyces albus]
MFLFEHLHASARRPVADPGEFFAAGRSGGAELPSATAAHYGVTMSSSLLGDYAVFGVLLLAGFAFVAFAMLANRVLRPSAPPRRACEP